MHMPRCGNLPRLELLVLKSETLSMKYACTCGNRTFNPWAKHLSTREPHRELKSPTIQELKTLPWIATQNCGVYAKLMILFGGSHGQGRLTQKVNESVDVGAAISTGYGLK